MQRLERDVWDVAARLLLPVVGSTPTSHGRELGGGKKQGGVMQTQDFISQIVGTRNAVAQAETLLHQVRIDIDDATRQLAQAHKTMEHMVSYLNRIGIEIITLEDDKK